MEKTERLKKDMRDLSKDISDLYHDYIEVIHKQKAVGMLNAIKNGVTPFAVRHPFNTLKANKEKLKKQITLLKGS
ncbi:MAG: hypothetical protein OXM55_00995 [Bdellovibrionales bacterium]|nr:hypothetical protein [Bdellovibrionales bacterium]